MDNNGLLLYSGQDQIKEGARLASIRLWLNVQDLYVPIHIAIHIRWPSWLTKLVALANGCCHFLSLPWPHHAYAR